MKTFRFMALATVALFAFASCEKTAEEGGETTFTVTVTDDGNGTAAADPAEAAAGETVTITATPNEGFIFAGWTVSSGKVALADATASVTTFTMPAEDVEINVTFTAAIDDTEDILPKIKDAGLKEYVEVRMKSIEDINGTTYVAWDSNGDGKLTVLEASEVTAMNISARDIYTFEDLQYFPNLEVLLMDRIFDATDGADYLPMLAKLKTVSADGVDFGEKLLDLTGCTELNSFSCVEGYLSGGIDVSKCSKLVDFDINYADATGELDLSGCTSLATIDITFNERLSGTLDLSNCKEIERVEAGYTGYETVLLPENSKITNFDMGYGNLKELDMSCLPNVQWISVAQTQLESLDLSKCTKLKQLVCSYSPVGSIDLSNCPDIDLLWAKGCKLTEIDLSGCSKLFEILIEHNNLKEIDASECGFYVDETTGELTNSFLYQLGAQVEPGTEPKGYDYSEGTMTGMLLELNHKAWAGLVDDSGVDYSYVKPIQVEVTLSEAHRDYWEAAAGTLPVNQPVGEGSTGNVKIRFVN